MVCYEFQVHFVLMNQIIKDDKKGVGGIHVGLDAFLNGRFYSQYFFCNNSKVGLFKIAVTLFLNSDSLILSIKH